MTDLVYLSSCLVSIIKIPRYKCSKCGFTVEGQLNIGTIQIKGCPNCMVQAINHNFDTMQEIKDDTDMEKQNDRCSKKSN